MNLRKAIMSWMKKGAVYDWTSPAGFVPVRRPFNPQAHVANAYSSNAIAHACISRIAKDIAGLPMLYLSDPDDDTSYVRDDDPIAMLFDRPNQVFTRRRLIEWTTTLRMLRGECFWRFDMTGQRGSPRAVFPWYDPMYWNEIVTKQAGLIGWEYHHNQDQFKVDATQVLWMGAIDPTNPYRGQSPLKAAASSLGIDNTADALQGDTLARGGERGMVLAPSDPTLDLTPEQVDQHRKILAMRRPGDGQASRDVILPAALSLQDPKFTREDLNFLNMQTMSKKKICHVYGMAPILIGDDDSAQYKSAPEAIKLYWAQTLIPLLRSYEDAWDRFFTRERNMKTFVRFDLSGVGALREDEAIKASTARVYHSMGIPLTVLNDKLDLGFNEADMIAAEDAANARREAVASAFGSISGGKTARKGLCNATIKMRALDVITKSQRNRMLNKIEINVAKAIAELGKRVGDTVAKEIMATGLPVEQIATAAAAKVSDALGPIREGLLAAVEPSQRRAAEVGIVSVQDIVTGKAAEPWHDRVKTAMFSPIIDRLFATRRMYVLQAAANWIMALAEWVSAAAVDYSERGESLQSFASAVRDQFDHIGRDRGRMIARTEIGTVYNAARFDEMANQGFTHHEWLAVIDANSRETHEMADGEVVPLGAAFSMGLTYPQESGAPPEEVINCRCETIPAIKD